MKRKPDNIRALLATLTVGLASMSGAPAAIAATEAAKPATPASAGASKPRTARADNPCAGNPCAGKRSRRASGDDANPCAGSSRKRAAGDNPCAGQKK